MKTLALTVTLAVWGISSAFAQTLPVIGTVLHGQVKNALSSTTLTNEAQYSISNTGPVPLQFYMAATATAAYSGKGVTLSAGQQKNVSVGDLGGIALGKFINVDNSTTGSILPGTFSLDVVSPFTDPLSCTVGAEVGIVYHKLNTANYFFCSPLINGSSTIQLGIGTNNPQHALHVQGDAYVAQGMRVDGDAAVGTLTAQGNISTAGNAFANGIGIGTSNVGDFKLAVNGDIRCKRVKVETNWSDFVFEKDYTLMPLHEVEAYIQSNHHLPEIPAAAEVENNGADVGSLLKQQMQKIEELTLYVIQQQKEIDILKQRLDKK